MSQLGNSSVSWLRRRGSHAHILAVDTELFTPDTRPVIIIIIIIIIVISRFAILRAGDTWTLAIREVRLRDEGTYQCQVSSVNRSHSHTHRTVQGFFMIQYFLSFFYFPSARLRKLVDLVVVTPRVSISPTAGLHVQVSCD